MEEYEEVRNLVAIGKDRGFLAYDEISEALPEELTSTAEVIEDVFTVLETHGIELVDSDAKEQLAPAGPTARPRGTEAPSKHTAPS